MILIPSAHLDLSAMDNSSVTPILNIWDIWRYNWLSTFIRVTLADREEETRYEEVWAMIEILGDMIWILSTCLA